ncbi:MAG: CotH kinase family protein [Chloroherpetonaceae bacterium]|nr:CotH kinase family protein [Chthonomonadaceae bacterium]MDW8209436.1 CotH kinase family protein [Chloroherpetonaceae bacterium]
MERDRTVVCVALAVVFCWLFAVSTALASGSVVQKQSPDTPSEQPTPRGAQKKKGDPGAASDASVRFFREGIVPRLKIQIPDFELQRLRQQPREYVRCTVIEDNRVTYEHVAIKLKGFAGSFRGVDDRPALTLNFDKFRKGQKFHDLDKIHLNNSVQDPTYLNELLGSELFLAAGVPAARTTHARVWLNGRDLGLYVLKEGFNRDFLRRNGLNPKGNLYEGPPIQDIDGPVELESGDGPADRSDVRAVIEACHEPDPARRRQRIEQTVDVERFLTFQAMEALLCHWDGYCRNRNNYRFYFDPATRKIQFFPHGMDQLFGDPGYNVMDGIESMVARALWGYPDWQARYRKRVTQLARLIVPPDRLLRRVDEVHQRLRPVLQEISENHARDFDEQVHALKQRLTARASNLAGQLALSEPAPPVIARTAPTTIPLTAWVPRVETPGALLEQRKAAGPASPGVLLIAAGPGGRCVASWRTRVPLTAGRYRFEARVRTEGVQALREPPGTGAGIRISGVSRANGLEGTTGWTRIAHEFEVLAPTQEVELVAELRAAAGRAFFEINSLRLVRVR